MCGRYSITHPELIKSGGQLGLFEASAVYPIPPRYNVAPTDLIPAIRRIKSDQLDVRQLDLFRWGLIPFWAKDPSEGAKMINARAESAPDKPAFRRAFRERRCLIPADGFYEWRKLGKKKQPYWIRLKEGGLLAFAGLWERWRAPDGTPIESCSILTTDANELVSPLHDRMPVILDPKDYDLWLDPTVQSPELLEQALRPFPSEKMVATPVNPRVNSVKNDDPGCIEPEPEPEPPASEGDAQQKLFS